MIPDYMRPFTNHLWQSTLFALAVWVIMLALQKNRAAVRHRLWLAASVKFLVPFSVLASIGSHFQWQTTSVAPPLPLTMIVASIGQPFRHRVQPAYQPVQLPRRRPVGFLPFSSPSGCVALRPVFYGGSSAGGSPPSGAPCVAFEFQWTPSGDVRSRAFRTRSVRNLQARPAAA